MTDTAIQQSDTTNDKPDKVTGAVMISVVVPMYNEEESISEFFIRLMPVMDGLGLEYEIICVDDGSKDATWSLVSSCPFKLDSRTVDQAKRPQTISKIASPSKKDDSASPILPYLRPRGLVSSNEPLFSGRRAQVSTGSSNRSVDMVDSESQPGLGRKRARRIRLWVNTAEWT